MEEPRWKDLKSSKDAAVMTKKLEKFDETVLEFYGKDTPSPHQIEFHNDKHRYTCLVVRSI